MCKILTINFSYWRHEYDKSNISNDRGFFEDYVKCFIFPKFEQLYIRKVIYMYIEIVNKVRKIVLRETPGRYTKRSCSSSNCHVTHCARDLSMQRA